MRVCAVASGTSADDLDVAVVDLGLDGSNVTMETVLWRSHPWPDGVREQVLALRPPATTSAAAICFLDQRIGQAVADAVEATIAMLDRPPHLVVSPGQTLFHDVRDGVCVGTLQIGQPAWVAERTGLPVVSDLRSRDVAAGGHGAALASTFDALWLAGPGGPRAALNLGGIATVSIVGDEGAPVLAWDTGPANCLLDAAAARVTGGRQTRDDDGRLAASGTVVAPLLDLFLEHPHFSLAPPVSTGREAFSAGYLDDVLARYGDVSGPDLLATLTELTASSVARALAPFGVLGVVASGGGVHNPALMAALRHRLGGAQLVTSDELRHPRRRQGGRDVGPARVPHLARRARLHPGPGSRCPPRARPDHPGRRPAPAAAAGERLPPAAATPPRPGAGSSTVTSRAT